MSVSDLSMVGLGLGGCCDLFWLVSIDGRLIVGIGILGIEGPAMSVGGSSKMGSVGNKVVSKKRMSLVMITFLLVGSKHLYPLTCLSKLN
jgi:hypothetical protein